MLQDKEGQWILNNGLIQLEVCQTRSVIPWISETGGQNLLANPVYVDANFREATDALDTTYISMSKDMPIVPTVWQNGDDLVDVSVMTILKGLNTGSLVVDWHMVLCKDICGFYTYMLMRHVDGMDTVYLEQLRMVTQTNPEYFDRYYMDDDHQGHIEFEAYIGDKARKYEYGTREIGINPFHGLYGENGPYSFWNIYPSYDFYQSLDKKYILIEDNPIGAYLHNYYFSLHYIGVSGVKQIRSKWDKVYGPNLFYITKGSEKREFLEEIHEQVCIQSETWPYPWVRNSWTGILGNIDHVTGRLAQEHKGVVEIVVETDSGDVRIPVKSNGWFLGALPAGGQFSVSLNGCEEQRRIVEIQTGELKWIDFSVSDCR